MKKIRILISGRVVGVNFRNFARTEAEKLGVKGYVRNLKSEVEVVAEGEEEKLKAFEKICRRGPLLAFVKDVKVTEEKPTGEFEEFEVRF